MELALFAYQLLILSFAAMALALPVVAVRDILQHDAAAWEAAGRSRARWVALVVVVPVLGAVTYYGFVRTRVRAASMDRTGGW